METVARHCLKVLLTVLCTIVTMTTWMPISLPLWTCKVEEESSEQRTMLCTVWPVASKPHILYGVRYTNIKYLYPKSHNTVDLRDGVHCRSNAGTFEDLMMLNGDFFYVLLLGQNDIYTDFPLPKMKWNNLKLTCLRGLWYSMTHWICNNGQKHST